MGKYQIINEENIQMDINQNEDNIQNENLKKIYILIELMMNILNANTVHKLKFPINTSSSNLWKNKCIKERKNLILLNINESNNKNQEYLNYLLMKIIVDEYRTFNLFESNNFKELFRIFLNEFSIPCYNTIKQFYHEKVEIKIKEVIKDIQNFSLTMTCGLVLQKIII